MVTGSPGAGKTTFALSFAYAARTNWRTVHADDFVDQVFKDRGPAPWESLRPLTADHCARAVAKHFREESNVVVEGIFMNLDEIRTLARGAGLTYPNPAVRVVRLLSTEDTCVARRLDTDWEVNVPPDGREELIRTFHRTFRPAPIPGELCLWTDLVSPQEVRDAVVARLSSTDGIDAAGSPPLWE